jgi:serine/threonine-protein kinase
MTGFSLSHYHIDGELGRGGMGIVYKATDTKLNRTVALKVLPPSVLASEDDRARFFREAQAAAQLHHPNIATVFEIDEAIPVMEGQEPQPGAVKQPFIAMEYIDGVTLADHIKKGPVPLKEAVSIVGQIAEALKAAHAKEIVHRDIKSANVMLTQDQVAKVLDFGLAKTNQSTMLTRMGSTLGTVAYMSPEQARGQEVDGRSDLYSLGTVLYEMVAGHPPFAGDYEQAVLYSILNEPPEPLTAIRTGVPMQLEWITTKLLSKEAEYRYQSAAGLLADLKSLDLGGSGRSSRSMPTIQPIPEVDASRKAALPAWLWVAAVGITVVSLGAGWLLRTPENSATVDGPVVRSTIDVMESERPPFGLAISKDGRRLAYTDYSTVWVRDLQTGDVWEVPGAGSVYQLDFNEDGSWLLLVGLNWAKRAPVRGGRPVDVIETSSRENDAIWGPDNTVLYFDGGQIHRIGTGGGNSDVLLSPDSSRGQVEFQEPFLTQDGSTLLVRIALANGQNQIGVYDYPAMDERGIIDPGGKYPMYFSSGHLVYNVTGELMGRPFDLTSARPLGPPVPLATDITRRAWSVSRDGLMASAYQVAFSASRGSEQGLRIFRQRWNEEPEVLSVQADGYDDMQLAPDGRSLIVEVDGAEDQDLWRVDIETGVRNRLTMNGDGDDPAWAPSGADSILYINRNTSTSRIIVASADGSGEPRVVLEADSARFEYPDWSPDRSTIAYGRNGAGTDSEDIWLLDTATGKTRPAIGGEAAQSQPRFSPDGRYLLYTSRDQNNENRIFVQPTSLDGGRWDVSRGRGYDARWASDGSAIYFRRGRELVRVRVELGDTFSILGNPEPVITRESRLGDWSLLPDGSGIVSVMQNSEGDEARPSPDIPVDLVFNWFVELEQKAPHPRPRD